jgi:hypothetical protein
MLEIVSMIQNQLTMLPDLSFYSIKSYLAQFTHMDKATLGTVAYATYLYVVMDGPNHTSNRRKRR